MVLCPLKSNRTTDIRNGPGQHPFNILHTFVSSVSFIFPEHLFSVVFLSSHGPTCSALPSISHLPAAAIRGTRQKLRVLTILSPQFALNRFHHILDRSSQTGNSTTCTNHRNPKFPSQALGASQLTEQSRRTPHFPGPPPSVFRHQIVYSRIASSATPKLLTCGKSPTVRLLPTSASALLGSTT